MINYIITVLLSVVSGMLVFMLQNAIKENHQLRTEQKEKQETAQKALSGGVMSLLKIQLIEYHDKYMMTDIIPSYVYENFDEMYKCYEALGGNGMVKRMKDDMDRMKLGGHHEST